MANAADYGEWKTGRRITGLSFSGNLFALKLGMAFAGALVGFSLGWFGYHAGAETQTALATTGIIGLLTVGPSISYLILYFLARFYKLDDATMKNIQHDLAKRSVEIAREQENEAGHMAPVMAVK